jgi:hypothetical protein
MRKLVLSILWLLLGWSWSSAQTGTLSSLRNTCVVPDTGWQQVDTAYIYPSSLILVASTGDTLSDDRFVFSDNRIQWLPPLPDSVCISYRVFPFNWTQPASRIDTQSIKKGAGVAEGITFNPYERDVLPFEDMQGLDYSGNFARGLSFGNAQNLVLNSSFNLQMAGTIGDGIEIRAAITDENIPIQPEGNTQQLSEFDRIFIQLRKGQHSLTAGDYELPRPNSYFMNYFKKLQGATYQLQDFEVGSGKVNTQASVAVARGRFARNEILGQEGNQGPYRLQGAEGERFIIILAGTEKVFIDGRLLKRGLEEDYVIDYNQGFLRFTNKQLITKDIRIIVEFEYNVQNYLRTLSAADVEYDIGSWSFFGHWYSEQDGRSALGDNPLSSQDLQVLGLAGDNLNQAVVSSIDTATSLANPITYSLVDTLVNGAFFPDVLVYTPRTSEDQVLYNATFSDVGMGNGNYIRPPSDANGFVFVWVAPDPVLGPQGQFEPVNRLVPPQQQQMITGGAERRLKKGGKVRTEVAFTHYDQNRFSDLDAADDWGIGVFSTYTQQHRLSDRWRLSTTASYEGRQAAFEDLNPYRPPEFIRDWNYNPDTRKIEHLGRARLDLRNDSLGTQLNYGINLFLRENAYQGIRHDGRWLVDRPKLLVDLQGSLLTNQSSEENSQFFRPKALIEKYFRDQEGWTLGFYFEQEKNSRVSPVDTLLGSSFYYDLYRAYLRSPQNKSLRGGLQALQRDDFAPADSLFSGTSRAREIRLDAEWRFKQVFRLALDLKYRNLEILDPTRIEVDPAETYLGRIDYGFSLAKGVIRYNGNYQIGSGQEQRILFVYQRVLDGGGVYQHIDFNGDGQEQNNEFVVAPTQDLATHVRVIVYTEEFIRTNNVIFNQNFQLEPKAVWFDKDGIRGFLARFSLTSSWQINRNVRDFPEISPWNPFQLDVTDTALVSTRNTIQHTLFFNRLNPKYDLQLNWSDNQSKVVLTTGFESRRNLEQALRGRWNINQGLAATVILARGNRLNDWELFTNRNYDIAYWKVEPKLTWLPVNTFNLSAKYRWERGVNATALGGEVGEFHDFQLESTLNQAAKTSFQLSASFVQVDFNGEANSAVGFAFLNGLQAGRNFLWSLTLNRQVARNIQISINYEGRKNGMAQVVHIGRAQVAATF